MNSLTHTHEHKKMGKYEVIDRHNFRRGGAFSLGSDTFIGERVSIDISDHVTIGNWCIIAEDTLIETHKHDMEEPRNPAKITFCPVQIEDDVWIAARCMILCGVRHIAKGVRVYAGSIVTHPIDVPFSRWAGVPARLIGMRDAKGT